MGPVKRHAREGKGRDEEGIRDLRAGLGEGREEKDGYIIISVCNICSSSNNNSISIRD